MLHSSVIKEALCDLTKKEKALFSRLPPILLSNKGLVLTPSV